MNNENINDMTAKNDQEKVSQNSFDGFLQMLKKRHTITLQGWVYGLIALLAILLIVD